MQRDKATLQAADSYLIKDGLAQEEFNRIAHFKTADGTIFFGMEQRVTAFQPEDFYPANPAPVTAPLCITAFQQFDYAQQKLVDRTAQLWQDQVITIQPRDRFFQLEFTLLAYENVEKIRYAWKIDGLDADWNYQPERSIRLSRAAFWPDVLRIKAQWPMDNGRPASGLSMHVIRPFYCSGWFFAATGLFVLISTYSLYRWRIRTPASGIAKNGD